MYVCLCASVFLLLLHFFVICRECCCLFLHNVHRFDFDYSMTIFAIDCVSDCHSQSVVFVYGSCACLCMSVAHYHCRQRVEWIFVQIEITSANIREHHVWICHRKFYCDSTHNNSIWTETLWIKSFQSINALSLLRLNMSITNQSPIVNRWKLMAAYVRFVSLFKTIRCLSKVTYCTHMCIV